MKLAVLVLSSAFVVSATNSHAAPINADDMLVCKGHGKTVNVYPHTAGYQLEVDGGTGAMVVATQLEYRADQDLYVGRVTEKTALEDAGFLVNGPIALKSDSLIIQDPYTGSASVVWDGLMCRARKLLY